MSFLGLVTGLALAPTAVYGVAAALRALAQAALQGWAAFPFLAGAALCPAAHWLFARPMRFYVLGHELTHGLAAVLSGSRVKSMKVSPNGGHVVLDKSNAVVALAPYLVPLYAVVWLAALRLAGLWTAVPGWLTAGGLGYFLSFHVCMTATTLWEEHQTDLDQAGGVLSSMAWILLVNSAVVVAAVKGLYPRAVSLHALGRGVAADTAQFWRTAGSLAAQAAGWAASEISRRV